MRVNSDSVSNEIDEMELQCEKLRKFENRQNSRASRGMGWYCFMPSDMNFVARPLKTDSEVSCFFERTTNPPTALPNWPNSLHFWCGFWIAIYNLSSHLPLFHLPMLTLRTCSYPVFHLSGILIVNLPRMLMPFWVKSIGARDYRLVGPRRSLASFCFKIQGVQKVSPTTHNPAS
jgi:hypothetical protein